MRQDGMILPITMLMIPLVDRYVQRGLTPHDLLVIFGGQAVEALALNVSTPEV